MRSATDLTDQDLLPLPLSVRRRAWVTFGVMMGMVLGALEATAVVTAMPTVVSTLGGLELYSWVYSVYFLATTVTVPLWGRLSDLYGRRRFYLAGIGFFLVGSVLSGLSQSMPQLIFFRAIQGLGAGALVPLGMTIIGDIYSLERRAKIQGLFSGIWGLSSLVGPLAGGLITDFLSWRWVFFLNAPFGLLAAAIIGMALSEPKRTTSHQIDYRGAFLLVVSLSAFLVALDQWKGGAGALPAMLSVAALVLLACFLLVERKAREPILPLHLFRDRLFTAAALNGFFSGMALFGAITFIPLFVQGVIGTGATQAGWALTPLTLSWVVFSVISGRLLLVVGYRKTVVAGMVSLVLGFYFLSGVDSSVEVWQMVLYMILIGAGMGLSLVSLLIAVQNRFPRNLLGIATSATTFFRTIGASVGIAIMGMVMVRKMATQLAELRLGVDQAELAYFAARPEAIVNPVLREQIPLAAREPLQDILGLALSDVFFVGFVIALFAFFSAFLVPAGSAREHARRK